MNSSLAKLSKGDGGLEKHILNQIPTPVMAVNPNFEVMYINDAGSRMLNRPVDQILGKKCDQVFCSKHCNSDDCCMKKAFADGESYSSRNELNHGLESMPVEYHAVPLRDEDGEIVGGLEFIVDITEQTKYEARLIDQSHTIRQMATPTIKMWEGVLVLPVVGVVDSVRAQHMMESILNKIVSTYSKVIILDIQGVAAVDTAVANHLIKITKATKLMGCQCILSGISPAVAQTIIQLGIDMHGIITKATLSDALEETFTLLELEVVSKKNGRCLDE